MAAPIIDRGTVQELSMSDFLTNGVRKRQNLCFENRQASRAKLVWKNRLEGSLRGILQTLCGSHLKEASTLLSDVPKLSGEFSVKYKAAYSGAVQTLYTRVLKEHVKYKAIESICKLRDGLALIREKSNLIDMVNNRPYANDTKENV